MQRADVGVGGGEMMPMLAGDDSAAWGDDARRGHGRSILSTPLPPPLDSCAYAYMGKNWDNHFSTLGAWSLTMCRGYLYVNY